MSVSEELDQCDNLAAGLTTIPGELKDRIEFVLRDFG